MRHEVAELRPEGRDLFLGEREPREARDVANVDPVRWHDPPRFALGDLRSVRRTAETHKVCDETARTFFTVRAGAGQG